MRVSVGDEGDSGSHSSVFTTLCCQIRYASSLKVGQLLSLTGLLHDISASLSIEGQPLTLQWFEIIHQFKAALTHLQPPPPPSLAGIVE